MIYVTKMEYRVNQNTGTHSLIEDGSIRYFGGNPASILYKSTAGRFRTVSYPDGPITARYRLIKNAYWEMIITVDDFCNNSFKDYPSPKIMFSTVRSRAVPLLQVFLVRSSVASYVVMYVFFFFFFFFFFVVVVVFVSVVRHLSFIWCLGNAVLHDCDIFCVSLIV